MTWQFRPQPLDLVETEVTQRDQFSNDDVLLSETIVREAVQNSLDAGVPGETVEVRFKIVSAEDGLDAPYIEGLLSPQLKHGAAAGADVTSLDLGKPKALIIEDFGTIGLTGKVDQIEDENFSDFWRRHGKSHKKGTSRGRWGLGKLVYSSSSRVRVFFGLTRRKGGDSRAYLMGQSVLGLHDLEGVKYPAHSFYSDMHGEGQTAIQVPIKEESRVKEFSEKFGITRDGEPGLSVVIPYPTEGLNTDQMIGVGIANYFYPLITGQLVLRFGDQEINSENIRSLAKGNHGGKLIDIDHLFDFIEEFQSLDDSDLLELDKSWANDDILDEADFSVEILEQVREKFEKRKMVGVKLPLDLELKEGTLVETAFRVYLKRPEGISKGQDLYVRGGLTLPGEAKFRERRAIGVMIAEEEQIASFLGDAENAAHTKWVANAEKLKKNYRKPKRRLKVIKNSLLNFYDLLSQSAQEDDDDILLDIFSLEPEPKSERKPGKRKKPTTPDKPDPPPPSRPRVVDVVDVPGGFAIRPGPGINSDSLPLDCTVHVAYATSRGDPFKNHHPLDFNFERERDSGLSFDMSPPGSVVLPVRGKNRLDFRINQEKFNIKIEGFDRDRDLKVKVRTSEGA